MSYRAKFVITEDRAYWSQGGGYYHEILELNKLNIPAESFVRAALVPPNGNFLAPFPQWTYRDYQSYRPAWYSRKKAESLARQELPAWFHSNIIPPNVSITDLERGAIAVYGTISTVGKHARIFHLEKSGSIHSVYGAHILYVRGEIFTADSVLIHVVESSGYINRADGCTHIIQSRGSIITLDDRASINRVSGGGIARVKGHASIRRLEAGSIVSSLSGMARILHADPGSGIIVAKDNSIIYNLQSEVGTLENNAIVIHASPSANIREIKDSARVLSRS